MLWNIYRPAGNATWQQFVRDPETGTQSLETLTGYDHLDMVGTVEARSAEEAIRKARNWRDPSPIVEPTYQW